MQWKIFQFVPSRYISQMTNRHESMYTSPNDSIQSLIIVIIITLYIQLSILPINILFDMMSSVMWSKKRFPLRKNFKVLLSIKFFFPLFPFPMRDSCVRECASAIPLHPPQSLGRRTLRFCRTHTIFLPIVNEILSTFARIFYKL